MSKSATRSNGKESAAERSRRPHAPIAPCWHTALLVALYVTVAATGMVLVGRGATITTESTASRVTSVYLPLLGAQLGLAAYVGCVGRKRCVFGALIGAGRTTVASLAIDLPLAFGAWLLILAAEMAWTRLPGPVGAPAIQAMLPETTRERLVWSVAAVVVGCCEELVFRGYLLTQFLAFTHRPTVAICAQALLFGVAHANQGAGAIARITLIGLLLGAVAYCRRSLVAVIVCHVWTDLWSGS